MRVLTDEAPLGVPAVRTGQLIRVEMAFAPQRIGTIIKCLVQDHERSCASEPGMADYDV
jgi:hypothetical protein